MILWTIQPEEVVDIINRDGVFTCNTKLSENYEDLKEAYDWLVSEMIRRNILPPTNVYLPLWAWHTRDWKHEVPDYVNESITTPGQKCVCIEFEIDDDKVLLSDYDNWHMVLNDCWFDDSTSEEEWDKLHEWYDTLDRTTQYVMKLESWQKVFDVTPSCSDWSIKGAYVQATFWELRKDMIRDIKYFTAV